MKTNQTLTQNFYELSARPAVLFALAVALSLIPSLSTSVLDQPAALFQQATETFVSSTYEASDLFVASAYGSYWGASDLGSASSEAYAAVVARAAENMSDDLNLSTKTVVASVLSAFAVDPSVRAAAVPLANPLGITLSVAYDPSSQTTALQDEGRFGYLQYLPDAMIDTTLQYEHAVGSAFYSAADTSAAALNASVEWERALRAGVDERLAAGGSV